MMPDYFHFLLTGKKVQEYTNATTTQLVSPVTKDWDEQLIRQLGYRDGCFGEIRCRGMNWGSLRGRSRKKWDFSCKVILPPPHDTASAVAAVPTQEEETLYISSGTWSLMGTERMTADCSGESAQHDKRGRLRLPVPLSEKYHGTLDDPVCPRESAPELGFERSVRAPQRRRLHRVSTSTMRDFWRRRT